MLVLSSAVAPGQEPSAPKLDAVDKRFLSRVARRTYEQFQNDHTTYAPAYTPSNLREIDTEIVVTLRGQGLPLGLGSSSRQPIVHAVVFAVIAAVKSGEGTTPFPDQRSVLIEIEAIGQDVPVEIHGEWLEPSDVDRIFEPGLDGLTLQKGRELRRITPADLALKNLLPSDAVKPLMERVPGSRTQQALGRFRSAHWYQPNAGAEIVQLRRGLRLVTADEVNARSIETALNMLAKQFQRRRKPNATFKHEYEPAAAVYHDGGDASTQAGAAWAVGRLRTTQHNAKWTKLADDTLRRALQRIVSLKDLPQVACVTTPNNRNPLALTANTWLALSASSREGDIAEARAKLINGMLWLQQDTGEFLTAFPPARRLGPIDVNTGPALVALADAYRESPDERIAIAFSKALPFYKTAFAEKPTIPFAGWFAQAYARMAVAANRREFARFAFELADRLIEHQMTPDNSPWPELHGGVRPSGQRVPDIDTALCITAWLDAMETARAFREPERALRYHSAADRAARFVLQLQIRDEEAFHMLAKSDAVGGIRISPADNRVRLRSLQLAALALTRYHEHLGSDR